MRKSDPHLWDRNILLILNKYDDKNNRELISAYRKTIKLLQARLNKKADPHMIRVIIKKILKSYKKRLEKALDTLTSTPPSSEDEDVEKTNPKCCNIFSKKTRPSSNDEDAEKPNQISLMFSQITKSLTQKPKKQVESVNNNISKKNKSNLDNKIDINKKSKSNETKIYNLREIKIKSSRKAHVKQQLYLKSKRLLSDDTHREKVKCIKGKTTKLNQQRINRTKTMKCLKCKIDKNNCICNEIEKIDNTVLSWRFSMCITCAYQCKGENFDDLYESSNNCHKERHKIIHSTTRLHIQGKFSAAVDYINACRMFFLKNYMDTRYYLEEAILKSCARENKLNAFVRDYSTALLSKINKKEKISENQLPDILTLSEILAKSENCTLGNKISKKNKQPLINQLITLTRRENSKDSGDDSKIKIGRKTMTISYKTNKIATSNTKSIMTRKKIIRSKQPSKLTFKKTKTVNSLRTFSQIARFGKHVKSNVFMNLNSKKPKKVLKFNCDRSKPNEKSKNINIRMSNKYSDSGVSLLFDASHERKRKRVDYAKLNNIGFDKSCSPKRSQTDYHNASRRNEKPPSESKLNHKNMRF